MESTNLVTWSEPPSIISIVERAELYQANVINITEDEIKNAMNGIVMEKNNPGPDSEYTASDRLFIYNPEEWSPKRCVCMATKDMLTLSNEHWIIISIFRSFYLEKQCPPPIRLARKNIAKHLGRKNKPLIDRREFYLYFALVLLCQIAKYKLYVQNLLNQKTSL